MGQVADYPKLSTISTAWMLGVSFLSVLGVLMFFYFQAESDHEWIDKTGKPHVERHEQQQQLKDYQFNEIVKSLETIKQDLKELKEKRK